MIKQVQEVSKSVIQEVQQVSGIADNLLSPSFTHSGAWGTSGSSSKTSTIRLQNTKIRYMTIDYSTSNGGPVGTFNSASITLELNIILLTGEVISIYSVTQSMTQGQNTKGVLISILNEYLFKDATLQIVQTVSATSNNVNYAVSSTQTLKVFLERDITQG